MFSITEDVTRALLATKAVNVTQLEKLAGLSVTEDIGNWALADFQELSGFSDASGFVAWKIVQEHKVTAPLETIVSALPERPSYLSRPEDYDPHDGSQFYTTPTGEMYRWDGKGRKRNEAGEYTAENTWGKRRPVIEMPHVTVQGIQIPDPQKVPEVLKAVRIKQADWFHRGFRCWINPSGKPYGVVSPEVRDRVVRAIRTMQDNPYVTAA